MRPLKPRYLLSETLCNWLSMSESCSSRRWHGKRQGKKELSSKPDILFFICFPTTLHTLSLIRRWTWRLLWSQRYLLGTHSLSRIAGHLKILFFPWLQDPELCILWHADVPFLPVTLVSLASALNPRTTWRVFKLKSAGCPELLLHSQLVSSSQSVSDQCNLQIKLHFC